jgi:hypothetical protein
MRALLLTFLLASVAASQTLDTPQSSFIGGQMSPLMVARPEIASYRYGCRELTNMLVLDVGAATRRPGSVYVATAPGKPRLEPFVYAEDDSDVLEFTHNLMRVYNGTGQVLDGNDAYSLATTFDGNDIFKIHTVQSGNVMTLVDGVQAPQQLTRTDHNDWTIEDIEFTGGPYRTENTTDTTISTNVEITEDFEDGYTESNAYKVWIREATWAAQTFTPDSNYTASTIRLKLNKLGYPREMTVSIRATDANEPNGPDLASGVMDTATITDQQLGDWYTIGLDSTTELIAGTRYAIIVRCPNPAPLLWTTAFIHWRYHTSGDYEGGEAFTSGNSGSTWSQFGAGAYDFSFAVLGQAAEPITQTVTLTASDDVFDANHVGALWRLRHLLPAQEQTDSIDANEPGRSLLIGPGGQWELTTTGTWSGLLLVERSYDAGYTWETVGNLESNVTEFIELEDSANALYRVRMTEYQSGSCTATLSTDRHFSYAEYYVTDVNDPCIATATLRSSFGVPGSTTYWSEGAWSDYRGWPNAITSHAGRMIYGRDLTLWFSRVGEPTAFGNFFAAADEGFSWELSQSRDNPIRWLLPDRNEGILAGSLGKVHELRSLDGLSGFTPTNPPKVASATWVPCSYVYPVGSDASVLFLDRSRRHLHELLYDDAQQGVIAPDITYLAGNVLGTGVTQLAMQQSPYPILWAVRDDGRLASCYYSPSYGAAAWSTHTTGATDSYVSLAVVPSTDATSPQRDRVWTAVQRTVDSNSVYYVEYMAPIDLHGEEDQAWFVDSGLSFDGGAAVSVSDVNQTNPALVTLASWPDDGDGTPLADGDQILFADVVGMTELNGNVYTIDDANSTALTFTLNDSDDLNDVNAVDFTAYLSGGTIQRVENTFAGLGHLTGKRLAIFADGAALPDYQYSGESDFDVWVIARFPGSGINYVLVALTTDITDYLTEGDTVTFSGVTGAPWMDGEWPITDVRTQAVASSATPDWGSRDVTTFRLADPNGNLYDATGLEFVYADLPPETLGATCALDHVVGDDGTIVTDAWYNRLLAGLPYTSVLTPLEVDVLASAGSTRPMFKRIVGLLVHVYESQGGQYGPSADVLTDLFDDETTTYSGPRVVTFHGGANRTATYTIQQSDPLPMTVVGVDPIWEAR